MEFASQLSIILWIVYLSYLAHSQLLHHVSGTDCVIYLVNTFFLSLVLLRLQIYRYKSVRMHMCMYAYIYVYA